MSSRGGVFWTLTGFDNSVAVVLSSPPWELRSGPFLSFGPPRFGQFDSISPNTPPRDFGGNGNRGYHGGSGGKGRFNNGSSPAFTPRRQNPSPRGASYRNSPYHSPSPGQHMGYQVTIEWFLCCCCCLHFVINGHFILATRVCVLVDLVLFHLLFPHSDASELTQARCN